MKRIFVLLSIFFIAASALGHGGGTSKAEVALDERLGGYVASDTVFKDEKGGITNLGRLLDRPLIIAPVYLKCTHTCPMLLTGLAEALGRLEMVTPGKDFRVVALSFDETDTPETAREKKANYIAAIGRPFPEEAWTFLTGDAENIGKFTDSIGFKIQRDDAEFSHPVAIVVVSPGGKIVRYLYGVTFLPFDIAMAVTEAAEGRVGSTARRVLMYCFSYDPTEKSYVFNVLKVTATVVIIFVGSFLSFLIISGRRRKKAENIP